MAERELKELIGRERILHRAPALFALVGIGVLYLLVSARLTLGPPWLPLVLVVAFVASVVVESWRPRPAGVRRAALLLNGAVTVALIGSTGLLVSLLLGGGTAIDPTSLLQGAAIIWIVNVLTFAVWYYEIDGGGPLARRRQGGAPSDFLFPQYTIQVGEAPVGSPAAWRPEFIDYLFLAFNTSAAFSPTDTLTLSRTAKLLMMTQSLLSLATIAVLLARAVNTLR